MKKVFTVACLMIGFAFGSQAQQSPTITKETKKEQKAKLKEELNLSKEQEDKLTAAEKEFRTRAKTIKENPSLSGEQKKEQFKALHKERLEKTNTILTPEQQQKRNEMKKHGHHKRKDATK